MKSLLPMNQSGTDRAVRVVAGLVLLALAAFLGPVWMIVAAVVGAILLVTGAVGSCPIYTALGLSTRSEDASHDAPTT